MRRRGFALIIVLWTVLGATAAAMAANAIARSSLNAARNGQNMARAHWRAADCLERARSLIEASLTAGESSVISSSQARMPWRSVDRTLSARSPYMPLDCSVSARASGSALDMNSADAELLVNMFLALGQPPLSADSLKDALLDWRDADDIPRPRGAERDWYRAHHRAEPRNAPMASAGELPRVRGFENQTRLARLVDVEPGRIALQNAPATLLRALPGMGPEAVARVGELRSRGESIPELVAFAGMLSPAARSAMLARYADLTRLTTPEPDSWIVTATGVSGSPAVRAELEVVLVRAGSRAAITRRRTWFE